MRFNELLFGNFGFSLETEGALRGGKFYSYNGFRTGYESSQTSPARGVTCQFNSRCAAAFFGGSTASGPELTPRVTMQGSVLTLGSATRQGEHGRPRLVRGMSNDVTRHAWSTWSDPGAPSIAALGHGA